MTTPPDCRLQLLFGSIAKLSGQVIKEITARSAVRVVALERVVNPTDYRQSQNSAGDQFFARQNVRFGISTAEFGQDQSPSIKMHQAEQLACLNQWQQVVQFKIERC